ncbi:MAG: transglutaminase-like domain-containing protein, partial [Candidatus Omnitrophica bacterium]|nr:transglutaminase-like domain-containing protein [Candidatus Omnitrophota bacterium]
GFFFQSEEPFMFSQYTLTLPENKNLYTYPFSVELKEKTKKSKFYTYQWAKNNMPAIIPEHMMPPASEIVPKILVTTIKDWEIIGRWFFNLSRDSTNPDSSIIATALKITEKASTDEEKIKAVYHYICQNIRYIGLELGIHGFKPHDAKDVLKLGYGDCKDKSALMVAMLKALGIKSYIALINTERQIEENVPFPGQFNHAIVAVWKNNDFLILDPTSEVIPYPELPPSDQNKVVLIPTEQKTFLIRTASADPDNNQKKREITAFFDATGNLQANVSIKMNGIFAASIRNGFRYLSDEERKRELLRSLNRIIPNTSLKSFKVEGISSLEVPVEQSYSFSSKRYATAIQTKLLFKPALIEKIEGTELVSLEKRNFPIRLPYKSSNIDKITFVLPDNYVVDALPDPVEIKTNFGFYTTKFNAENNTLIYERIFTLNALEIKPEDYIEFKNFYEQVAHNDSLQVILKKSH